MSQQQQDNFKIDIAAMVTFGLDSDEVDDALSIAGLDRDTATDQQALDACREYANEHWAAPLPPWA